MIRTIVTPQNTGLHIFIPDNYVGKQVEILLYALEEVEAPKAGMTTTTKKKPSEFFGTLSLEDGEKMQAYITQSRNEWERNI